MCRCPETPFQGSPQSARGSAALVHSCSGWEPISSLPEPAASVRKPSVYAGKTNPPPFTMRLSDSFVNGKSVVLHVFSGFFAIFGRSCRFFGHFCGIADRLGSILPLIVCDAELRGRHSQKTPQNNAERSDQPEERTPFLLDSVSQRPVERVDQRSRQTKTRDDLAGKFLL
jgi:hypothetical protein